MCECYKVGGPFIAEDPDCPVHGWAAQREQEERQRESQALEDRLANLEAEVAKLKKEAPKVGPLVPRPIRGLSGHPDLLSAS